MSLWSKILKIAGAAGLGAAGAVTGGATWTGIPALLAAGTAGLGAATSGGSPLEAAGSAIGKATSASGNNRLTQEQLALEANRQNIGGQSAFEQELIARAAAEDAQRSGARKDAYRASVANNLSSSPFNPRPQVLSSQFKSDMGNVGSNASRRLAAPSKYGVTDMPALPAYTPLDIKDLQASTGTEKGTLEKIGDWAGPISSVLGRYLKMKNPGMRPEDEDQVDTTGYGGYGTDDWMNH